MKTPRLLIALLPLICAALLLACSSPGRSPDSNAPARISTTLPDHPRLIATPAVWQELATRRAAEPDLNRFVDTLITRARSDIKLAPLQRKLEGRRLLGVSREFVRRTQLWAFAYRVTGERVFLDRARQEMLNVAAFSDWNPSHYLDVAEMSAGMALSYDWLYHDLSLQDRATIRKGLLENGIEQARYGHKTFGYTNNWGQVCIGGMVLGALAVEEDEPALTKDLLAAARKNAFTSLDAYKPDGVYPEGPGYWSYGTTYSTVLIAALRSTLGTDWGITDAQGLKASTTFYAQAIGPSGKAFNFADGGENPELTPPAFYLARELKQPALVTAQLAMIAAKQGLQERFAPLIALWWPRAGENELPPSGFSGQGPQPTAIWRSAWNDPNALYFAIKGGGSNHNHAHMDGGSFVLDLDGVRWALDLGMQSYESLESRGFDLWNMNQSSPRWKVFRLSNDAHNTLSIDNSQHNAKGMASLQMQNANEALLDLSPVFQSGQVKRASRLARFDNTAVTLSDDISGAKPGSNIRWAMNTEASIALKDKEAVLTQNGKRLVVRFSGTPVTLEVRDISKPRADFDTPNPRIKQLIAHAPAEADGTWRVSVKLSRD